MYTRSFLHGVFPPLPNLPLHHQHRQHRNLPSTSPLLLSVPSAALSLTPPLATLSPSPQPTSSDLQDDAGGGPLELPPSSASSSIFATTDDPTPLQVSTSVLLTGAISVFLFRSLRRRAKRAKEMRVRSSGLTDSKSIKNEAMESLKALSSASLGPKASPSPVQAFLGGLAAGAIAIILYKFTTTIEASLNRQAISDNFSVRQLTITIRTIINGLCYLATFVFGINSVGLVLYSVQLALGSLMGSEPSNTSQGQEKDPPLNVSMSTGGSPSENEAEDSNTTKKSQEES